jgi:hypothetical protein
MADRLLELAARLAERDRDLAPALDRARRAAEALRSRTARAAERFRNAVSESAAEHLGHLEVGPVEPDDKHVDSVQCRLRRGRHEAIIVAKAAGKVTLVGPFKRGKPEKPCADLPLEGPEVEQALEDLLVRLIEQASER